MTEMITFSPVDTVPATAFREVMTQFANCVTVISAAGPVGCTATAVFSISADPPSLGVCLASGSRTLQAIQDAGAFAVNLLSAPQRALTARFATGSPERRFDGVPVVWHRGTPVLANAAATVICRLHESVPVLDHTLLVGLVLEAEVTWGARPIVYYQRGHHELGGRA